MNMKASSEFICCQDAKTRKGERVRDKKKKVACRFTVSMRVKRMVVALMVTVAAAELPAASRQSAVGLPAARPLAGRRAAAMTQSQSLDLSGGEVVSRDSGLGVLAVLGGAFGHMVLGTLYCWGNFIAYAPEHLRYFDAASAKSGKEADALGVIPLTILFQVCALPLGPLLIKQIGTRWTSLVAGSLIATGVYCASFAKSLKTFLLFYACLFGSGVGLGYTSPLQAGWSWFPGHKGSVNGIVLMGFGFGGAVANLLGSKIVNPEGIAPVKGLFPKEVYDRFPRMLRTLALVYFGAVLLGGSQVRTKPSTLILLPKEEENKKTLQQFDERRRGLLPLLSWLLLGGFLKKQSPSAEQMTTSTTSSSSSSKARMKKMTVLEGVRTPTFFALYLIIALTASPGLTWASIYKVFANASPKIAKSSDGFLATCGALGAVMNGLGRFCCAAAVDHLGFKKPFFALVVVQSLNTFFFPIAAKIGPSAFLLSTCVSFFLLGGVFSMAPTCCASAFGPDIAASVYSLVFSAFAIASIGGVQLARQLIPSLGWTSVFYFLAAATALAAPFLALIDVP